MARMPPEHRPVERSVVRTDWRRPPDAPPLSPETLHLWCAPLGVGTATLTAFRETLLSARECAQADRYVFAADRDQYVAAQGILRMVLASYLERPAGRIVFCRGEHGKPALAGEDGDGALHFNLSHSHNVALIAVGRGREVGVDVEAVRADRDHARLAKRYFAPSEIDALNALPPTGRAEAFFSAWTLKEAFMKATGDGLSFGLGNFEVALPGRGGSQLVRVRGSGAAARGWFLRSVDVHPGYAAAVAVEGPSRRLTVLHVQGGRDVPP
jgi:4'-phosphopantetheinyl transferase